MRLRIILVIAITESFFRSIDAFYKHNALFSSNAVLIKLSAKSSRKTGNKLLDGDRQPQDIKPPPKGKQAIKEKSQRDPNYNPIIMYNDERIKPWSLADSFNSTTLKFLFEIKVIVAQAISLVHHSTA
jgi:DNA replication initiation complex subunit (GINS family)